MSNGYGYINLDSLQQLVPHHSLRTILQSIITCFINMAHPIIEYIPQHPTFIAEARGVDFANLTADVIGELKAGLAEVGRRRHRTQSADQTVRGSDSAQHWPGRQRSRGVQPHVRRAGRHHAL